MENIQKQGMIASYKLLWKFMTHKDRVCFVFIFLFSIVTALTKTFESFLPSLIVAKFTGERIFILKYFDFLKLNTLNYIILMFAIIIVLWILGMLHYRMIDVFARRMMCRVNHRAQEIILMKRKNLEFNMTIGEANYILKSAVDNIYDMIEPFCWNMAAYFLSVIIMVWQLFSLNLWVGLGTILILILIFICVYVRMRFQKIIVDKIENTNAKIGNHFLMVLSNLPMITILQSKKKEQQELDKQNQQFFKEHKKRANLGFWYWNIVIIIEYVGVAALLIIYLSMNEGSAVAASITIIVSGIGAIYAMVEDWGFIVCDIQAASIKFMNINKLYPSEYFGELSNEQESIAKNDNLKIKSLKIINYSVHLGSFEKMYNVKFNSGKVYVISGQSGQGKTTLINAMCGLRECDSGKIVINGEIETKSLYDYRDKISYLFQDSVLFDRSFEENVAYPDEQMNDRAKELVKFFELDKIQERAKYYSIKQILSGGEKKRLDIIRALSKDKDIYFLDEPTNELDAKNVEKVLEVIKNLAKEDKIVILISHDKRALTIADEVVKLQ